MRIPDRKNKWFNRPPTLILVMGSLQKRNQHRRGKKRMEHRQKTAKKKKRTKQRSLIQTQKTVKMIDMQKTQKFLCQPLLPSSTSAYQKGGMSADPPPADDLRPMTPESCWVTVKMIDIQKTQKLLCQPHCYCFRLRPAHIEKVERVLTLPQQMT